MYPVCFAIACILTILGVVCLIVAHAGWRRFGALVCALAADVFLLIPLSLAEAQSHGSSVINGIIQIPYDILALLVFESRIDTYWELVQATSPQFGDWYFFLLQLLSMATFILAATIAISLVTRQLMPVRIRIRSWFFKLFHPSGRVYIVSGFDSRSQIFVRSVLEGQGKPASLCIIANVDKETVEESSSAVAYFKEQGAFFTEISVSRLTSMLVVQAAEPHKRRLLYGLQIHYLYLNDEEKANLSEAVKFLGSLGSSLTGDMCFDSEGSPLFHVYIACHGQSDELLLDSIRSLYERSTDAASGGEATVLKGVDVRVLDEWRDIAFKLLWDHPLTEALTERGIEAARDLLHKKGQDEVGLTAIILGFGAHGFEVFRTISWFGQIPGVRLRIVVRTSVPRASFRKRCCSAAPSFSHRASSTASSSRWTSRRRSSRP